MARVLKSRGRTPLAEGRVSFGHTMIGDQETFSVSVCPADGSPIVSVYLQPSEARRLKQWLGEQDVSDRVIVKHEDPTVELVGVSLARLEKCARRAIEAGRDDTTPQPYWTGDGYLMPAPDQNGARVFTYVPGKWG